MYENSLKKFFDFSEDCWFDGCLELRRAYANEMNADSAPCCGSRRVIKEKYEKLLIKKIEKLYEAQKKI